MTQKIEFNLFASATKVESKTKTTKDKEKVFVAGLEPDLLRKAEIKIALSNLKTEDEMISGRIKEVGKEIWLKQLAQKKCRPESFQICDGNGKVLFMVMDAYKKVEEAKENELQAFPDVLETTTTFSINPDILSKPGVGEALSNAIMAAEGISDEDKKALLLMEQKTAVKKGTIDRLLTFPNYEQLFALIEPTVALK